MMNNRYQQIQQARVSSSLHSHETSHRAHTHLRHVREVSYMFRTPPCTMTYIITCIWNSLRGNMREQDVNR